MISYQRHLEELRLSTTDTAVAENRAGKRLLDERATALGSGLIRLGDATYLRPSSSKLQVRCLGPLAHWQISNTFTVSELPEGEEHLLFVFPLPGEAALQGLSIADDRLLPGPLKVKVASDLPDDVELPVPTEDFLADLGNETLPVLTLKVNRWSESLGDGGLEIALDFASGLPTVDGRIQLTCPTAVSSSLPTVGLTEFELTVVIEDANELVDEPDFGIDFSSTKEEETLILTASFEASEAPAENVFVSFRPGRTQMPVTRLRRSEEHFIFSIVPPTSIPASPQRRDLVFAVDASENFDPSDFVQVKQDICASLRKLDENDRFALVTFGRDIDGYDGGEFCEIDKVEAACTWLEEARPQGRADVQPLLQRIQSLPSQEDRQLCIFLLAAGHVGNEPAILKSLDFDQSDRRYYTVGIGPAVKQSFLRRLALLTRGRCEVSSRSGCGEALERLLGQTRALLAEVTFDQDEDSEMKGDSLVPSRMTSLTPQGPVHCLGAGAPSSLRFRSKDETGVFFAGTVNAQSTDNPALAGVWAGLRVRELLDSVNLTTGAQKKALEEEASGLAAEYGILTTDTVLVLETDGEFEIQYSAQPSNWGRGETKVKKGQVSNKDSSAPFDWRKGLVAREGLFKGSKAPSGGESGETSGRYGLRSKGAGSSETASKPRLDRSVSVSMNTEEDFEVTSVDAELEQVSSEAETLGERNSPESPESALDTGGTDTGESLDSDEAAEASHSSDEPSDSVEASLEQELEEPEQAVPAPLAKSPEMPESAPEVVSTTPVAVPVPVPVPAVQPPVMSFQADPNSEGRLRMAAYRAQMENFDTQLSLAALQGLPDDLSPRGGELSRILAQTVGHLEKRGYFSHAVAVLGLLIKDNPGAAEVVKKMESLLAAWADSLPQDKLPEAIQILQLGQRVCQGSAELSQKCREFFTRWGELSSEQAQLPEISLLNSAESPTDLATLLSRPQLEMAKLQQEQAGLSKQLTELKVQLEQNLSSLPELLNLADLKSSVEKQLSSLPALLEKVVQESAASMVSRTPVVQAPSEPRTTEQLATPIEVPLPPEAEAVKEELKPAPVPEAEPVSASVEDSDEDEFFDLPHPDALDKVDLSPNPQPVEQAEEAPAKEPPSIEIPIPEQKVEEAEAPDENDDEAQEGSGEEMVLTKEELIEMLLADPRSEDSRKAVEASLKEAKDRINFFRDMVKSDKSEPYHSLSLARAYREADQTKVAVVHYQKYLRSEKDPIAYLELAEAYDELGKATLGASARKAAEAYKSS